MHHTKKATAMRTAIVCFLCLGIFRGYCQDIIDEAPLHLQSSATSLTVTPKEKLIIVTRAGEIAYAATATSRWLKTYPVNNERDKFITGPLIDQANFFNNDTGFVSGFINNNRSYDIIYHTTDGGIKWKAVTFGKGGWVDDAVNLHNGEAWMSVSGDGIYYTSDYGINWKHSNFPEPKQRFAKIYFNTKKEGIIGSLWNLLAYTPDNCSTWQFLPTPLDQMAYKKTFTQDRPEIHRVAVLPGIFLVRQEELVFWSHRDTIEWKLLKGYDDFYTDAYHSGVYFKKDGKTIVKTDLSLKIQAEISLEYHVRDATCLNGKLFLYSGNKICKVDETNAISYYDLLTNEKKSIEPVLIGFGEKGTYGHIGAKVYTQKDYNEEWHYDFTLPFEVNGGELSMRNDFILYKKNDSLIFYSMATRMEDRTSLPDLFSDYTKEKITEINFEKGSQGCFHSHRNTMTYRQDCGIYAYEDVQIMEQRDAFPEAPPSFDERYILNFLQQLPKSLTVLPTIASLGISEKDYQQCKEDILAFKNAVSGEKNKKKKETRFSFRRNNLDFDRLLTLVDSVKALSPARLNTLLDNLSEIVSTTSNWTSIAFTNAKGQKLVLTHYYYEPNSIMFPWTVYLNGFSINVKSPLITDLVKKVYPALIQKKDNLDVLYRLVKQMY